ncbi:MAG: TCR/Tet family MFS transporter [Paracoccaceae bacterium]|nr:TCR/Tet family MFS transporter [Paracoccaceae bacterium]MDE2911418.1 TCR/Tet family MFS transporter [Paracoccaceae bacterium]
MLGDVAGTLAGGAQLIAAPGPYLGGPDPVSARFAITFILVTVVIDAMGIGLIVPVMPDLIRDLRGLDLSAAAVWGGLLATSFAAMQFLFGPALGSLSDSRGRRPVLLISLVVMGIDYLIMGLTASIWILLAGRIIGGITAATNATALAYVADISEADRKSQNFGLVGAAFGAGFILGPLLGGVLSEFGSRAPFFAACALAFANAAFGYFVLPETVTARTRRPFSLERANPFGALRHVGRVRGAAPLLVAFFLHSLAFFVYPAVWSFYTQEQFRWDPFMVGISLAAVGVSIILVQGGLIRVILPRFGEWRTVIGGTGITCMVFLAYGFAREGWMVFVLIPLSSLGMVSNPVLQGLLSKSASDDAQGELQGVLAAITAVATILSPMVMTLTFRVFTRDEAPVYLPGAPFLLSSLIELAAMLVLIAAVRDWFRST